MSKFNIFEIKLGKEKKPLKYWIRFGAIVHLLLDVVSIIPKVEKRKVFNLIDEFQLKMKIEPLNDYIIQDSELMSYRIDRVIDKSIQDYEESRKDS